MVNSSNFQKMVWQEIEKIPYGETKTYKDITHKQHEAHKKTNNTKRMNKQTKQRQRAKQTKLY